MRYKRIKADEQNGYVCQDGSNGSSADNYITNEELFHNEKGGYTELEETFS